MLVSEILHTLPAPLEWMVLFNLSAIKEFADEATTRAMYHLPENLDLTPYSHVVLSSGGRFLASQEESKLIEPFSGKWWSKDRIKKSLYERFTTQLDIFAVDEADCVGLGETPPYSPVLLHIKIESGYGKAQAIFAEEPTFEHYELLRAVGVQFLEGKYHDSYYLAKFQNRLPVHIHAGILSHFSRTAHCNLFFLQHGQIDPPLEEGLLKAAEARISWGKNYCLQALAKLAQKACEKSMSMICQPPAPANPFLYGDLVPLGFVLKVLNTSPESIALTEQLQSFLLNKREGNLWAFHSNRLITATDSALILQGFNDSDGVEALEEFADGKGGYYPQLWSTEKQPGKMVYDESCSHWCQADYATTCLVKALREKAGLDRKTTTDYLKAGFATRSGLYFANPYLVDWVLARAIAHDKNAASLREKLLREILASMNQDYSFGLYDVIFSTALAILCMAELGFKGRTVLASQLRLLEFLDSQTTPPVSIAFYSSLRLFPEQMDKKTWLGLLMSQMVAKQKQIRQVEEQYHGISLYLDSYQMITTSLVALALSEKSLPQQQDLSIAKEEIHPRYQCSNHTEYIAKFALPPYTKSGYETYVRQKVEGRRQKGFLGFGETNFKGDE